MDYKVFFGYLATTISFVSYVPYVKNILQNKIKPHAFSWFVWGLLTTIALIAQIYKDAGAGAWVTASTAIACFLVFGLALFKGIKDFTTFDWIALFTALISTILWVLTKNPTAAVILITIIDAIGFLPTYRKGFQKPFEESLGLYSASTVKYIFGIFALQSFSLATWLFPASLILTNAVFVALLIWRRIILKPKAIK